MKRQIVLIAAVAALLLGLAISAAGAAPANPVSLPVAGTPSAAGINAAPDTTYTQWEYTSLDNQGGHTFGQPGSERVTFVGPVEVVIVGDGALEYNHNGDSMLSADCAPTQYGPTFCIPNSGSVMQLSVPAGMSKTFYCWGASCSWWADDSATRLPNLVCQTLLDGCGPQGNGCYNGIFVTADWQNGAVWEHQWQGPQGPMGGVHFAEGTFGSAVLAGSCVPASTPTSTPTTPPPTATPTNTPSPTATPTSTPTTPPVCEGVVIKLSRQAPGGPWVSLGDPNGYPPSPYWYGLPPYHWTWELRFELTGRPGVVYQFTHVEVNGAGQPQRPNPFTWGPFTPYAFTHFLFRGSANGQACGQWDFGGNADPIGLVFLPLVVR